MIKEGDPTGSGVVDFTSFVSMMNKKMKKVTYIIYFSYQLYF